MNTLHRVRGIRLIWSEILCIDALVVTNGVLLEEAMVFVPWVTPGPEIKERLKMEASLPAPSHYFNVSAES